MVGALTALGLPGAAGAAASPLSPVPTVSAASWPLVQDGHQGTNVRTVQHLVTQHGHTTAVDGIFGPNTEREVRAFQQAEGLAVDGIVGPNTWAGLVVPVAEGSTATHAVEAAQEQLNKHGADLPVTGSFDTATGTAVRDFQDEHGIDPTGTVDTATWRELIAGVGAVGGYSLPLDRSAQPRSAYAASHHDYPAIDIPVWSGHSVYAVNGGRAVKIDQGSRGCGNGVQVTGRDGGVYTYCHFRSPAVASGEVEAGQLLGYSGTSGNSSGPHLHLQIKRNGTLVCPQRLLLAIYDGDTVPSIGSLPTSGCTH
ncbi:hypothetical protein GCM10027521_44240 [Amycolatopsis cihanbeyliensis]